MKDFVSKHKNFQDVYKRQDMDTEEKGWRQA